MCISGLDLMHALNGTMGKNYGPFYVSFLQACSYLIIGFYLWSRGFPLWLHFIPGIKFRTDNEPFKVTLHFFSLCLMLLHLLPAISLEVDISSGRNEAIQC